MPDPFSDPKSICIINKSKEIKYYAPDERGVHFWSDETFKEFVERVMSSNCVRMKIPRAK
jgi:hypothetical protein